MSAFDIVMALVVAAMVLDITFTLGRISGIRWAARAHMKFLSDLERENRVRSLRP